MKIGTLSGKRDSNSRPRPWQGRALPTELFPHYLLERRKVSFLYLRPESNRHARNGHRILSPARLPIPPLRHLYYPYKKPRFYRDLSGKRDSNSRPRPWQGRALPTELFPRCCLTVQRYAKYHSAQVLFKLFFNFFLLFENQYIYKVFLRKNKCIILLKKDILVFKWYFL